MTKQNGVDVWQSGFRYHPAPEHLCPDPVPVPQTEVTHHADPLLTGVRAVGVVY